ncbi:MAG: hypothetical protein MJY89_04180 [Bacteroidales bacterium]|nr:hypothetical protein [Bacteroidales bacterium]
MAQAQPENGLSGALMMEEVDNWQISVNTMDSGCRDRITSVVNRMQASGATRGVTADILKAMGYGGITAAVDIVATEVINLAKYRKQQKQKWMQMIQQENNYTDSLMYVSGVKDFYAETSGYGALDPSNINFDGISLRGMRNGDEVVFISCHIDTTRLDHLFQHSKFHLVVDTIAFNPFKCHLPNLAANGIRMMKDDKNGRDNSFKFSEREHLTIGMELSVYSSWINEAVMVQKDVLLGTFKMNVRIPDNVQSYHYSRAEALRDNKELVEMEGDCFVVPRSFMPISATERMWGTGEYNLKVKFRESCQFSQDATTNEKLKHWEKDYKQLRAMQKKGSQANEYFSTLWKQNGTTLVKTMVKQGLNSGLQSAGILPAGSSSGMSASKSK